MDSNTSFAPPGESAADLWLERSNFSGSLLGGVAYGVHLSIFVATTYWMTHARSRSKISWPFLAFACTMLALGTIQVGCNTKFDEMMFIDDRNIPGGPDAWLETMYDVPVDDLGNTAYIVANFLADGVLLYRLFVVWNNYFVVVIPFLTYLASTALSILTLYQLALPGASLWSKTTVVFALPYWSLTIALNIVMTLGISVRLLFLWRLEINTFGIEQSESNLYTSVVSMVIESGAMYSITGLVFIICYARNSNVQNIVLPVLGQVMCIAPDLILLRVALGRAWTNDTSTQISNWQVARPSTWFRSTGNGMTTTQLSTSTNVPMENITGTLASDDAVSGDKTSFVLTKLPESGVEDAV
ncbi:hypothetical protein DFH11DRAFT_1519658 [Phellopilus nigrolimitatus]|nr:hypothetical protein DFH11DRAFT_1519658 [Phellopilus nigrolimitatus]